MSAAPRVRYVAFDGAGRRVEGEESVARVEDAARRLRARGLIPIRLRVRRARPAAGRPGGRAVVSFARQLALMLRAGLSLRDALAFSREHLAHPGLRAATGRVEDAVSAGQPLSLAMEREQAFPPLLGRLLRAGETSGDLAGACARAADSLERSAELRTQLLGSLAHPALVLVAALGVLFFLSARVIPRFAEILALRDVPLPASTELILEGAEVIRRAGPPGFLVLGILVAANLLARRQATLRLWGDRALLALPGLGGLLRQAALAQFGRSLADFLRSGLALPEALEGLAAGQGNRHLGAALRDARRQVLGGRSLAESLEGFAADPLARQLVRAGEESGALPEVLAELGAHYEASFRRRMRWLTRCLEPTLLVVLGCLVGFVYLGFFQALFQLSRQA